MSKPAPDKIDEEVLAEIRCLAQAEHLKDIRAVVGEALGGGGDERGYSRGGIQLLHS